MKKFTIAILATIACLLFIAAIIIVIFALMNAVDTSMLNLWRIVLALPFALAAWRLYVLLDRKCD